MKGELVGANEVEKQSPVVGLDVPANMVDTLAQYQPNDLVRVVLVGKVQMVEQRQDYEDKNKTVGYLRLEMRKLDIQAADDQATQFEDLADD